MEKHKFIPSQVVIVKYYFKLMQIISLDSSKAREATAYFHSIIMEKLAQYSSQTR